MSKKLNTIAEAIEDIKQGKLIIVVDDENRENEGDFITAAANVTPEIINFMTKEGRGLICTPLTASRCEELELDLMVGRNTVLHETQFTVSIDLIGDGCTTGISASDRAKTIQALVNKDTKASDLGRPGHIFPLKAMDEGVLRRAGHTEASIDLARLAGFEPAGVLVEILKEDGEMARLDDLFLVAEKHNLKIISIEDLIKYRLEHESLVTEEVEVDMPTKHGHFKLIAFSENSSGVTHFALKKGDWKEGDAVLTRVHSSCVTGDLLDSLRCDCGDQLAEALDKIEAEGQGLFLYMQQEGRGIGLLNKLKAYKLQEEGLDTYEANEKLGFKMDQRDYGIGAQILRKLNVSKLRLMSNNPAKRIGLIGHGLEIVENVNLEIESNHFNTDYLSTKKNKGGHEIMK